MSYPFEVEIRPDLIDWTRQEDVSGRPIGILGFDLMEYLYDPPYKFHRSYKIKTHAIKASMIICFQLRSDSDIFLRWVNNSGEIEIPNDK